MNIDFTAPPPPKGGRQRGQTPLGLWLTELRSHPPLPAGVGFPAVAGPTRTAAPKSSAPVVSRAFNVPWDRSGKQL